MPVSCLTIIRPPSPSTCPPSSPKETEDKESTTLLNDASGGIPTRRDFFSTGRYKDMFIEFSDDGTPLRSAEDGAEVSKRKVKKLLKKYDNHVRTLQKHQTGSDDEE